MFSGILQWTSCVCYLACNSLPCDRRRGERGLLGTRRQAGPPRRRVWGYIDNLSLSLSLSLLSLSLYICICIVYNIVYIGGASPFRGSAPQVELFAGWVRKHLGSFGPHPRGVGAIQVPPFLCREFAKGALAKGGFSLHFKTAGARYACFPCKF